MKKRFTIDPGHGGPDPGAVNQDTLLQESTVVLNVGHELARLMVNDGRFAVSMTRTDNTFLSLSERAAIANRESSTLISIHCNAGGGKGFEGFTSPGLTRSDSLATSILNRMAHYSPNRIMRTDLQDGDPDKERKFAVLTRTRGRAVLIELEFIDTEGGEAFLRDRRNQVLMAKAIYEGICQEEFNDAGRAMNFAAGEASLEHDDTANALENLEPVERPGADLPMHTADGKGWKDMASAAGYRTARDYGQVVDMLNLARMQIIQDRESRQEKDAEIDSAMRRLVECVSSFSTALVMGALDREAREKQLLKDITELLE